MFDYAARRGRLLKTVAELGGQAMLVTDVINVRYLTGFSGDSSYLLLGPDHAFLLSDSRYDTQIGSECPDLELVTRTARSEMIDIMASTLQSTGWKKIVLESEAVTKQTFDQFSAKLPQIEWLDSQLLIQTQRAIKDEQEIATIRHSVQLAQRAFQVLRASLRASLTEQQAAYQIENTIRELGGQGRAFDTAVAVGARAALPHAGVSDVAIGSDTTLLIDWGANYQAYASDLTRMLITGQPSDKFCEIYEVVRQAQQKAIDMIRPGADLQAIDQAARGHIEAAGYGEFFGHGLGHGFGLQVHEQPRLSPISKGKLAAGMVVTVEPGIYLPGQCGVRLEDDVLVTAGGHEVLSDLPKSLDDNFVKLL